MSKHNRIPNEITMFVFRRKRRNILFVTTRYTDFTKNTNTEKMKYSKRRTFRVYVHSVNKIVAKGNVIAHTYMIVRM